ncbi:type 1 glutamine amidotransferase domain-containing protein [Geomonas subterranea]|uniref:Type 1 glutamine amidotransferase n=1 Tax=Geomonas subterranea TaxID=2847989 RepID=A0ABX8LH48_9BACT|nr:MULTISPECIES: type 1 glutamine amidotransferase domain-containing protein [Geomonas]QXE90057.1 type 1 glutamine amidotransferase [Geomonas subterranea]QXM07821.1 type 1 glutamine amidotransferase [Geomonas subterranea]
MKALILSADNFEDTELLVPLYRLREVGFSVVVASESPGTIHGKHGYEVPVDKLFSDIHAADYAILVLPGGKAPAAIRNIPAVQEIARAFMASEKPVAAICHGPQILVSAGLLKGRKATCYESVAPELRDAGAQYQDIEVLVDGNLITSRKPDDLPAFCRELTRMLKAQG